MSASSNLTLKQVENELKEVTDWFSLGLQLEITIAKLDLIEKKHPKEPERCKLDVLDFWFANAQDRSWQALLKALEAMEKHGRLVRRLNSEYCTDLCHEEGSVNAVLAESSDANEESTAKEIVFGKTNPCPSGDGACHSWTPAPHSGFNQGTSASPGLHPSTLPHSTENVYSKVESYEKFMPPDGCEYNDEDLEVETTKIMLKFGTLVTNVQRELEIQGITVEVLASHLQKIKALTSVYVTSNTPLLSDYMEEIRSQKTVRECIDVIAENYTSWFNHLLIENLIETFFNDNHIIRTKLQDFRDHFKEYCQSRLSKCPQEGWGSLFQRNASKLIIKVDREWTVAKVGQIPYIRDTIAKILGLQKQTLYLRTVRNGCIELIFLVPKFVADAAFPFSVEPDETANALSRAGVLELHCENFSFYRYSRNMNFRRDLYAWNPDKIVYVKHFIGETDENSGAMPEDEVRLSPEGQESSDANFQMVKQIVSHPPLPVPDLISPTPSLPERNSDLPISECEDLIQFTDTNENSVCTGVSAQCSDHGIFHRYSERTEDSDSWSGFSSLEYPVSSDEVCPSTEMLCRYNFNCSAGVDQPLLTSGGLSCEFDDTDKDDLTERLPFYSLPTQCSSDEYIHVCTGALYSDSTSCIAIV